MASGRLNPAQWAGLFALLVGVASCFLVPGRERDELGRTDGFSVERTFAHLQVIAQEPHPVGSRAHQAVREYILGVLHQLKVEVSEQSSTAASHLAGHTVGATVHNVLARIPGAKPDEPAVLLAAHYDSVPGSPGASDVGVWVAALLETARVLGSGPRLRRDVYLLFTDSEETGLLGAQAFVREHPAARRVGLALNYEARGTRGPVLMYQTSPDNGELVRRFAGGIASPHANSLLSALSQVLPNDSDTMAFLGAGWPVLGFAFAEGLEHYHRYTDTPQTLDRATLAQIPAHTLGLSRAFANLEQLPAPRSDAVYFDVWGRFLVVYSSGWAVAVGSLGLLAWVVMVLGGLSARQLGARGLVRGLLLQLLILAIALVVTVMLTVVSAACMDWFSWVARAPWVGFGSLLVVAGVSVHLVVRALGRAEARELVLGGLSVSVLLGAGLGWLAPGASPLWQWPVGAALLGWGLEMRLGARFPALASGVVAASIAVAACLATPVLAAALRIAGPSLLVVPVLIGATNAALVLPPLVPRGSPWPGRVGLGMVIAGVALVLGMTVFDRIRGPQTRTNSLVYAAEPDTRSARYLTYDAASDAWVRKLVPEQATAAPLPAFTRGPTALRQAPAGPTALPPPEIEVRAVRAEGQSRVIEVRVRSAALARCLHLWQTEGPKIVTLTLNTKPVQELVRFSPELDEIGLRILSGDRSQPGYNLVFCGLGEEPLVLDLRVMGSGEARMRLLEEIGSLPPSAQEILSVRPPEVGPSGSSDVTLVSRVLVL